MQLLQERDFSAFFTDTFQFIKENFVHLLTNYLIVNGLFLVIYFTLNYMTDVESMMNFGPLYFLSLLVSLIMVFVSISFVVIYMILYNQNDGTNFNYRDIFNYFGQNIGKILLFFLISLVLAIPLIIAFYIVMILFTITIVGILALPLVYAAFYLWFAMTFYEYMNTNKGYFDAMGYGFSLFMKKFWATTGSTALVFLIIFVIVGLALGAVGLFSELGKINMQNPESLNFFIDFIKSPGAMLVMILYTILFQFAQVNPGIIYFSQKEAFEGIKAKTNIDDIGKNEI